MKKNKIMHLSIKYHRANNGQLKRQKGVKSGLLSKNQFIVKNEKEKRTQTQNMCYQFEIL